MDCMVWTYQTFSWMTLVTTRALTTVVREISIFTISLFTVSEQSRMIPKLLFCSSLGLLACVVFLCFYFCCSVASIDRHWLITAVDGHFQSLHHSFGTHCHPTSKHPVLYLPLVNVLKHFFLFRQSFPDMVLWSYYAFVVYAIVFAILTKRENYDWHWH